MFSTQSFFPSWILLFNNANLFWLILLQKIKHIQEINNAKNFVSKNKTNKIT